MGMNEDYYAHLVNDVSFGKYDLPSLEQYEERAASLRDLGIPDGVVAASAQQDWHARGQNGCNFARPLGEQLKSVGTVSILAV